MKHWCAASLSKGLPHPWEQVLVIPPLKPSFSHPLLLNLKEKINRSIFYRLKKEKDLLLKMLWCPHFTYRWEAGEPLCGSTVWTHCAWCCPGGSLGALHPPVSLTPCLDPRLPTPKPSHYFSAEMLRCHHRKPGGLARDTVPGHPRLLEDLQSYTQQQNGNQEWDTDPSELHFPEEMYPSKVTAMNCPSLVLPGGLHCTNPNSVWEGIAALRIAVHRQIKTNKQKN